MWIYGIVVALACSEITFIDMMHTVFTLGAELENMSDEFIFYNMSLWRRFFWNLCLRVTSCPFK